MLTRQMIPVGKGGVSLGRGEPGPPLEIPQLLALLGAMTVHEPPTTLSAHLSWKNSAACLSLRGPHCLSGCPTAQLGISLTCISDIVPLQLMAPLAPSCPDDQVQCLILALKAFHCLYPEILLSLPTPKAHLPCSLFQAALPAFCPRESHCSFLGTVPSLVPPFSPSLTPCVWECLCCYVSLHGPGNDVSLDPQHHPRQGLVSRCYLAT